MSEYVDTASSQPNLTSSVNAESINNTPSTTADAEQVEVVLAVKKRKLTSDVWEHFTREDIGGQGKYTAVCKGCKRKFDGSSAKGTTHLRNHLKVCPLKGTSDIRQAFIGKSVDFVDGAPKMTTHKFDPLVERTFFAQMIAKHDLPFLMSEYAYFRRWITYCIPAYKCRSRNTVKKDVMDEREIGKNAVYKDIEESNSRVTLTTDGWTADHQNRGYFCVTCHYITNKWELRKRLIAFHVVHYPHDGLSLADWLRNRILEWNIDKKMFAVVVDNASQNSGMLDGLKNWLNDKNALVHNGDLFHVRCSAHIMNLIVKSGLTVIRELIGKIRDSVKYINGAVQRDEKFTLALVQTRLNPKRRVSLECDTRWNSTYDMLINALELQEGFKRLADLDSCYAPYLPSKEEWEMGAKVCKHLKVFKTATDALSGSKYPTAPLYFQYVCNIRECLKLWVTSPDRDIERMATLMQLKFDKYWEECSMVLTVAAVLDPRYKMTLVEAAFSNRNDDSEAFFVRKVRHFLEDLFLEYEDKSTVDENVGGCPSSRVEGLIFDDMFPLSARFKELAANQTTTTSVPKKSEIEMYLEEGLVLSTEPDNMFDLLSWWKHNGVRFSTLSKMARDILAIPCTTVPSESTFSQARRVIDDTRASLNSETVEALLCVKDWMPDL